MDFNFGDFDTWMKGLGMLGTGAGIAGTGFNVANMLQQQKQNERAYKQQQQFASAPVDWQQFYNPMNAAEEDMYKRQLTGDMAMRGLPRDSQLVSNEIARFLAETQGDRMRQAQEMGLNYRNSQAGLMGAYLPQQQMMNADISPIFAYMGRQRMQQKPGTQPSPTGAAITPGLTAQSGGQGGSFNDFLTQYEGGMQQLTPGVAQPWQAIGQQQAMTPNPAMGYDPTGYNANAMSFMPGQPYPGRQQTNVGKPPANMDMWY